MKLIDILARELKEWPKGAEAVDQSIVDREVYAYSRDEPGILSLSETGIFLTVQAEDPDIEVTRAEWQAAVDALNKPAAPEWNGEGVPPVGATVEIQKGEWGVRSESECFLNRPVLVAASFKTQELGVDMIAVDGGWLGCEVFRAEMARPVRTPEQIAAEERKQPTE